MRYHIEQRGGADLWGAWFTAVVDENGFKVLDVEYLYHSTRLTQSNNTKAMMTRKVQNERIAVRICEMMNKIDLDVNAPPDRKIELEL